MESLEEHEVRMRFDEILDRVGQGESVGVLRDGHRVATIIPAPPPPGAVDQAFARNQERRERFQNEGRGLSIKEILEARNEGRK